MSGNPVVNSQYMNHNARPAVATKSHEIIVTPSSHQPSSASPVLPGTRIDYINLPTSTSAPGGFINVGESYMKIKVRMNVAAGAGKTGRLPKCGVHSLVERVQVNSSSYVVEDTQHYNQLMSILMDMNQSDENNDGVRETLIGVSHTGHHGKQFTKENASDTKTEVITFCAPLMGQFWNSTENFMPVHNVSALDYSLTLCPASEGVVSVSAQGDATGFEILEWNLHLTYEEMAKSTEGMIQNKIGNSWSAGCWEVLRDNIGATQAHTHKINSNKSSLKTLAISYQDPSATSGNDKAEDALARFDPNVLTVQFSANGTLYPPNPIEGKVQQLAQTLKAFHALDKPNDKIDTFGKTNPVKTSNPDADQYLIAQSFEQNGLSNKAFSGISTLGQSPLCLVRADPTKNSGNFLGANVFYYSQYDCRYEISNGVIRVSY